ncbi:MAG: hypothetical protein HY815_22365, partial [Candidatus Riflebacteria bacterium]|nr:hypothetical protein [Candidatus Riflebacteria bacterium]
MSTWLPTRASGFVLCLLAGFAILPSYAETQDAEDLIRNLNRNVAYIGRCLQTSGLKPVSGKHKALYQTLKATSRAIDDLRAAAQARDKEFFRALNRMDQRVAELGLAYKASGWSNADITRAIDRLGKIMDLLQDNCSQVALRSKRHPEISAAERAAYGKMQAQVTVLKARLDRMNSQPPRGLRDLYYIESLVRI